MSDYNNKSRGQNTNTSGKGGNQNQQTEEEKRAERERRLEGLQQISSMGYNLSGRMPEVVSWTMTKDKVEELILKYARQWFGSDALGAELIQSEANPALFDAFVILPMNSKHIVSDELNGDEIAIHRNIRNASPQLKEFINRFSPHRDNATHRGRGRNIGIEVDVPRFIKLEFDEQGLEYAKMFERDKKVKTEVLIRPVWDETKDDIMELDEPRWREDDDERERKPRRIRKGAKFNYFRIYKIRHIGKERAGHFQKVAPYKVKL